MTTPFSFAQGFRCIGCGRRFALEGEVGTCPACGPVAGTLDVIYDTDALRDRFGADLLQSRDDATIWRYHELLPIRRAESIVPLPVGMTPLLPLDVDFGFDLPRRLYVKDDTRLPSGSTKDRATAVAVARAREIGADCIAAASTGNAASSLAMFAARAGLPCTILAPAAAPAAKLIQIRAHGARLLAVEGTYDQAFDLCADYCRRSGCYSRNTATNPLLGEGKKTLALEIWEQLGFRAPQFVLAPVGDGCILGGVHKGFRDLRDLGLIRYLPRLIGVQAEGSAALATAWRAGAAECESISARTLADSISVDRPRDQKKALRAVRESGGSFLTVSDDEILGALSQLASRAGLLVEPAAAAPFAALRVGMAAKLFTKESQVVLLHTGHGLKDMQSVESAAEGNLPRPLAPTPEALDELLAE